MKILDMDGNELLTADLSTGRIVEEKLLIAKHEAVQAVDEKWHYEVVNEYPNGGQEVRKVVDVPGVSAQAAWEEYETIYRYIPYTDAELKAPKPLSIEERICALERAASVQEYKAGTWYYRGDHVRFEEDVYTCIAPNGVVCVWSPMEYGTYWDKRR